MDDRGMTTMNDDLLDECVSVVVASIGACEYGGGRAEELRCLIHGEDRDDEDEAHCEYVVRLALNFLTVAEATDGFDPARISEYPLVLPT